MDILPMCVDCGYSCVYECSGSCRESCTAVCKDIVGLLSIDTQTLL
ncbi:MAG: hypothetical protein AB7V48_02420 [Sedimentibacter sp.]